MNYYWTTCPGCSCEVAIQFVERPQGLFGSVRRWSTDRTINDGRRMEVTREALSPEGGFSTACVCGATIEVRPAAIERATTEKPAG